MEQEKKSEINSELNLEMLFKTHEDIEYSIVKFLEWKEIKKLADSSKSLRNSILELGTTKEFKVGNESKTVQRSYKDMLVLLRQQSTIRTKIEKTNQSFAIKLSDWEGNSSNSIYHRFTPSCIAQEDICTPSQALFSLGGCLVGGTVGLGASFICQLSLPLTIAFGAGGAWKGCMAGTAAGYIARKGIPCIGQMTRDQIQKVEEDGEKELTKLLDDTEDAYVPRLSQ